jgi:dTDP-4-amino-4,6-dideoxygalactose transaminase
MKNNSMIREIAKSILRLVYHQALNLGKYIFRKPLTYPPLGSTTLDKDDVAIAKQWLRTQTKWDDQNIVREYEKKFAEWNGSAHAFAFLGGRVALSACIYALGLKTDDEVILPGYTCVVVPNAFHFAGIKTIYSDIELETYGLDASLLEGKITEKTKAIMLHHLYGLVCRDYEEIIEIARKHKLKIIEDCAHSTGAVYKGRKVGNYGDVAFYSSEQSKVFTTVMGGIATTNDAGIARQMMEYYNNAPLPDAKRIDKQLVNVLYNYYVFRHPWRWLMADVAEIFYINKQLLSTTQEEIRGLKPVNYGMRMPAPIASIGLNQLNKIDRYNQKRGEMAKIWYGWCQQNGYKTPMVIQDSVPVYLRYPVLVEEEKKMNTAWAINELGVQLGVWFVSNVHPAAWPVTGCPNANKAVRQCVNFPTIIDR